MWRWRLTPLLREKVRASRDTLRHRTLITEDFSAAVDFLSLLDFLDENRVGIIGICGWGGLALNAAAIDTRIRGTAAITMYDMSRVSATVISIRWMRTDVTNFENS